MTNATSAANPVVSRARRASYLDGLFHSERWSSRQAATALGVTHTYIGRRRSGDQDLSYEDIEMFAGLLRMTPEALFAGLRAAETMKDPAHEEAGSSECAPWDSNPEPIEYSKAPIAFLRPHPVPSKLKGEPRPVAYLDRDVPRYQKRVQL